MQTAAPKGDYVTVEDYLAAEEGSNIRHEYLGGLVYAMAGETTTHNSLSLNLATLIRARLKGGPCRLYMSDIRVNFDLRNDEYYYYPDIIVTCDRRDTDKRFIRYPKLIIEVSSPSTERVDRREKFLAYTTIGSLEEYVLVAQTSKEVTVFRRVKKWKSERVSGVNARLSLQSLGVTLRFSAIYEGI